jgi:serine/threonine-protein kinase
MESKPPRIRLDQLEPERFARLQAVLEETLDLPAEQVPAALDRLCGGDPELRADALSLLSADRELRASAGETGEFLSSRGLGLETLPEPPDPTEENLEGKRAGPYRILHEIGRGGMGRVYTAERADGQFERTVAIKVLRRGLDTDELLGRFLRERQILARLEHANIARLLDGGATEDGRPFLAMERVEGMPITEWCDTRAAPLDQRLSLFLSVCSAVQHAHRHLVVHRDLKPGNVLVTSDGEPKLLDFGIARLLAGHDTEGDPARAALTRPESLPLTPAYAAPEILRGEAASTVTDVYGLGLILYELLVGRRPFGQRGGSVEDLRSEVLNRAPTEPSKALIDSERAEAARRRSTTPDRLQHSLHGDLDAIVLTALATDPAERYGSVEALAEDIRRYLGHQPVLARRPSRWYRLRKLARRHAGAIAAGAAVLALLVAYAATTAIMLERQRQERARAEIAAKRALRIQKFLADMLGSAGPSRLGPGTEQLGSPSPDASVRDVLDRAARRAEEELRDDPPVLAGVQHSIAETYFALGLYTEAESHGRAALAIRERLGDDREVAETAIVLSQILERSTQYEEAIALARRAARIDSAAFGKESVEYAVALQNEAAILGKDGKQAEASKCIEEALRIGRAKLPPDDPRLIEILSSAAVNMGGAARYAEAEQLARDVLERVRRVYGDDHPRTATAMVNLATNLGQQKRHSQAEPYRRDVVAMRRRMLGAEHPSVGTALSDLGYTLREEGKLAEADSVLRESLALLTKVLGPEKRETLVAQSLLANLVLKEGRPQEAERLHRQVLAVRRRVLGPDHPLVGTSLLSLSDALVAQGRSNEALPYVREAVALRERVLPAGHPDIEKARERLAALEKTAAGR